MRVVFMGSPDFAVPALEALVGMGPGVEVVGVVSQPDRPAGRGRRLRPPPVKVCAMAHGLHITQPKKVRDGTLRKWIADLDADVAVVAAYGRILPQSVLDTPRLGCVNLHASLLPRWRGASPIQRAIASQDEASGVCLMQMDVGLDTGAVLARVVTPITANDTAATLSDRLSADGAALLVDALPKLVAGELVAQPQDDDLATLAPLLTKDEGQIPWHLPAAAVHAHIRAMTTWPGAWTRLVGGSDEKWKVFPTDAQVTGASGVPGTVLAVQAETVVVACGEGAIALGELQRPGRRRMGAGSALRGARLAAGAQFGAK
ncbi:MAG: methionyl-tRNA formyltransferase [Myxococcales bacterium]|nr:methionyl-tRNA formyltransferase [Myxococcales bacterium]